MMKLLYSSGIALFIVLLSSDITHFQLYWSIILPKFILLTVVICSLWIRNAHLFLSKFIEKFVFYRYKKIIVASIISLIIVLSSNELSNFQLHLTTTLGEFIGSLIITRLMLTTGIVFAFIYLIGGFFILLRIIIVTNCHSSLCLIFSAITFIFLMISPFFIINGYASYLKAIDIKKLIFRVENAPIFSTDLIDCYIKFTGVIVSANQFNSPQYRKPCAYYDSKVFAHWQAKAKKPAQGLQDQIKVIYQKQADNSLVQLMSSCGETVFIEMNDFVKFTPIKTADKFTVCPSLCTDKGEERYQYYSRQEKYYTQGEELLVYGKLIKTNTGEFYLKPTGLHYFVSMLLNNQELTSSFEEIVTEWNNKLLEESKNASNSLIAISVFFVIFFLMTR